MSDHAILCGDLKKFVASGVKVGFGTVETADPDTVKERKESLLNEMAYVKAERGFDVFFFTIVDMVNTRPGFSLALVRGSHPHVAPGRICSSWVLARLPWRRCIATPNPTGSGLKPGPG